MAKQSENAADAAEAPKKKGKKLVLIAGVLVLALGGGGAGAWYFMRPADSHEEKAPEPEKPAQFLPLESFTVNLAGDGSPQYLQAGLTLKLRHDAKIETIKERMPEIRNRILLILSGKKAAELLPLAGKQQLATELSDTVREIVGDAAGKPAPKKAKKAKKVEAEDEETAENADDAEAKDSEEAKPKSKAKAKKAKTEVAKNDIEVLFTSFIIQ